MERLGIITITLLCLVIVGCGDSEPKPYEVIKNPSDKATAQGNATKASPNPALGSESAPDGRMPTSSDSLPKLSKANAVADPRTIVWTAPSDWKQQKAGGMRIASYQVPEGGDLSVIVLGGDGGGLVPNINRWRNQVGLDPLDDAAAKATLTEVKSAVGTFKVVKLVNPNSENAICAALYFGADYLMTVKLTGPKACIEAQAKALSEFCAKAKAQ